MCLANYVLCFMFYWLSNNNQTAKDTRCTVRFGDGGIRMEEGEIGEVG